jgi:hypothetical protein
MVTDAEPVFATVMFLVVTLPRVTDPKLILDGDTVTEAPVALTVSATGGAAE